MLSAKELKKWALRIPAVLLLPGLTGCLTGNLWNGDYSYTNRHWADTNSLPELFQTKNGRDVVVVYVEGRDIDFATKRRAFLLYKNLTRMEAGKRPEFVDSGRAAKLSPIPLTTSSATNPDGRENGTHGELRPDGRHFTLFCKGKVQGTYSLPDYLARDKLTQQVVLTPVAVTADAAIVVLVTGSVVGLVYLIARSHASFNFTPTPDWSKPSD